VYRDGLAHGELRFQRCRWCGLRSAQVSVICGACGGSEFSWERSGGQGRIYALPRPNATGEAAHTAVVELDEGLRVRALLAPVAAYRLWAGARVELDAPTARAEHRPIFRPVAS
jgi:uncharacterized OB-fold protein